LAKAVSLVLEPVVAGIRQVLPDEGFTSIARNAALKGIEAAIAWVAGKDAADLASGKAIYTSTPGPWRRPTNGPVTSGFGPRGDGFHKGVDIAGGGATYAAANGLVQKVGWMGDGGIAIVINHGPGLWSYYAHNPSMSAVKVRPGDV